MAAVTNAVDQEAGRTSDKLTLLPLVALVVGSMIGGGVFNLPSDMSRHASPGAIVIGWVITGIGMLMLAFVYQGLAVRKPNLNAGPYAYAKAGFGDFIGFNSAWGYWISAFLGNVAYAVAIFSSLSYFLPFFGAGNNLVSIAGASICLWLIHTLVLTGVKQAAFVNIVTTFAKLVPLVIFLVVAVIAFNWDKFHFDFWGQAGTGGEALGGVIDQVKSTMLVTLWVFIGIEGASVYSARAANRADVGPCHPARLCRRACHLRAGIAPGAGPDDAAGAGRPQGPLHGRRSRSRRRRLGRGPDQSGADRVGRRGLPRLDPPLRRNTLCLRQGWHLPEMVRGRERRGLAGELALGDQRADPALPARQLLLPERLSFLLFHRLRGDPAALCLLRRLCAEAGALGRDLWRGGQKPQSRHDRRRASPRSTASGSSMRPASNIC